MKKKEMKTDIRNLPQHTMKGKVCIAPRILENRDGSRKALLTIRAGNGRRVKFQGFIGKNLEAMGKKSPYPLIEIGDKLKITYKEDYRQFADGTIHKVKQIDAIQWVHDNEDQVVSAPATTEVEEEPHSDLHEDQAVIAPAPPEEEEELPYI